jgi:putative tryptophan/tyrosine transport system substrate-binding protein
MRRREFIWLFGAGVAWPFAVLAQEPGRTYRLGFLYPVRLEPPDAVAAFFGELKRAGFVEGKNLTFEFRAFAPHPERMAEYAAELVKSDPDLILAAATAIPALQEATKTIPILGLGGDLVGMGLVNSMRRPNGNVTGVSFPTTELDGKRQDILIEAVPGLRQMAVLANAKDADTTARLDALKEAAHARNIELSIYRVASGQEIAAAIDSAKASGAQALNVLSSPTFFGLRHIIFERALALRLPTIYWMPDFSQEGGFASYGPSWVHIIGDIYARQAVQLLRGTKVADVPVEQPFKFDLVINLKTANAMGVTVPPALLARADKVIE